MTERIRTLLNWIVEGEHKALRAPLDEKTLEGIRAQIQREDMPLSRRAARRLKLLLENERVYVREDERIPGIRTIPEFPDIYAEGEKERIFAGHFIHEQGRVCNISSDYEGVLREGLLPRRARAEQTLAEGRGDRDFLEAAIETIDAVIAFADRYAEALPDGEAPADDSARELREALDALPVKEQIYTFLSVIGFEAQVDETLSSGGETLSEPALALKAQIQERVAAMTEQERVAFEETLLSSFPQEVIELDGVEYTFFVLELEVRVGDAVRIERYGFRLTDGVWTLASIAVAGADL